MHRKVGFRKFNVENLRRMAFDRNDSFNSCKKVAVNFPQTPAMNASMSR